MSTGLHTGQEVGPVVPHELWRWYETAKGVVFRLPNPATRCRDGRHTATVQFLDGTFGQLAWRPETTRLRPGWFGRLWERRRRSSRAASAKNETIKMEV